MNVQNLVAISSLSGLKNYNKVGAPFSVVIPGQTLTTGSFVSATASTPLNNANAISQLQIQYSGVQTDWNVVYGSINNYFASSTYEIESLYYFDSTNLNVFTVIANQSAGSVTIPSITVNCVGWLYVLLVRGRRRQPCQRLVIFFILGSNLFLKMLDFRINTHTQKC